MKPNTLLVTGGHPTPAIACIDYIKAHDSEVKIVFVGRRYINKTEKNDTFEYQEIAIDRNILFFNSVAKRGVRGVSSIAKSIKQAFEIFDNTKPDAILAFGGYISVPVCIAALIRGIPFYLHEQTSRPGNANRLLAALAKKVFISFEKTEQEFYFFPWQKSKVVYTGNPLRYEMLMTYSEKPNIMQHLTGNTLFVNGGNMGSHAVNVHIFSILQQLLLNMNVIHQVGNVDEFADWDKAQTILKEVETSGNKYKYIPVKHLKSSDMASVLSFSDLVICRGGANTFFELIAAKKPAIIIPLPYSARDEQEDHAQILTDYGVAEIFDQSQPSSTLFERIEVVIRSLAVHKKSYEKLENYNRRDAARSIWENIKE